MVHMQPVQFPVSVWVIIGPAVLAGLALLLFKVAHQLVGIGFHRSPKPRYRRRSRHRC